MRGDNVSKLMFGCNYQAAAQTVKLSDVDLTGHMGMRKTFLVRYKWDTEWIAAQFYFWTWSILHGRCMTTLGGEWPLNWNPSSCGCLQSDRMIISCFSSMPTWMSYGSPWVAPVRFMKVLSVWSVNNIPKKKKKYVFVADALNFFVSFKKKLHFAATGNIRRQESLTESYAFDLI